ncbi:MAG: Grx4 family monothiol glutaredoxin [Hyphomicrobiales bacterium]|jgi:monothiol glutaredoxin|nr:Grx4 family monothiol glutaredoxin [Hyphomicrobiales bacterium]|tara:strand:+ start:125 stop:454 length:330 start_codon:yes stop_codon:yes gene_type:complete
MEENITNLLHQKITSSDVVLFMKGTPDLPQCGFSSQVVQILNYLGIEFSTVNVLDDDKIRSGIKEYTNWPTIPQLYVKSEFIGGADIIKEMFEENELKQFFIDQGIKTN